MSVTLLFRKLGKKRVSGLTIDPRIQTSWSASETKTQCLALPVDPRVGISRSASETEDRLYFSVTLESKADVGITDLTEHRYIRMTSKYGKKALSLKCFYGYHRALNLTTPSTQFRLLKVCYVIRIASSRRF